VTGARAARIRRATCYRAVTALPRGLYLTQRAAFAAAAAAATDVREDAQRAHAHRSDPRVERKARQA